MHYIKRIVAAGLFAALFAAGNLLHATTYSMQQATSGWSWCSACANAGGGATTSMTEHISSPSLTGNAARFTLGGTKPWSHALYYKRVSSNTSATHFVYDVSFNLDKPANSSGMEFSVSQRLNYKWYRVDTQCSFLLGNWRIWDNANSRWINTSIPCHRPAGYSWSHLVVEGVRSNGKVVFVSLTWNGHKYYINKSYYPSSLSTYGASINMHFQLNGDRYQNDYAAWGDKFTIQAY